VCQMNDVNRTIREVDKRVRRGSAYALSLYSFVLQSGKVSKGDSAHHPMGITSASSPGLA
jgi:hypothetical protein